MSSSRSDALASRTVLVTGATRGIGRALAERLAGRGWSVVGIARKAEDGFPGTLVTADLADEKATAGALDEISSNFEVDSLVNNAGFNHVELLGQVDLGRFDEIIAVNLRAAIQCAQGCLPAMKAKGFGRIVNIASRAALGREGRTSYGAAKAGLIGMTRTWAIELAGHGITANVVSPGPTDTGMFARNNPDEGGFLEKFTASIPMKRFARPEEVAAGIEFFLGEDASYVTGQTLHVCGGMTVGHAPL